MDIRRRVTVVNNTNVFLVLIQLSTVVPLGTDFVYCPQLQYLSSYFVLTLGCSDRGRSEKLPLSLVLFLGFD